MEGGEITFPVILLYKIFTGKVISPPFYFLKTRREVDSKTTTIGPGLPVQSQIGDQKWEGSGKASYPNIRSMKVQESPMNARVGTRVTPLIERRMLIQVYIV